MLLLLQMYAETRGDLLVSYWHIVRLFYPSLLPNLPILTLLTKCSPPKCCKDSGRLTLRMMGHALSEELQAEYRLKLTEMKEPEPIYCSNKKAGCSNFITQTTLPTKSQLVWSAA